MRSMPEREVESIRCGFARVLITKLPMRSDAMKPDPNDRFLYVD